jgi:hypothetical protein
MLSKEQGARSKEIGQRDRGQRNRALREEAWRCDRHAFTISRCYVQPRSRKISNKIGIGIPKSQRRM